MFKALTNIVTGKRLHMNRLGQAALEQVETVLAADDPAWEMAIDHMFAVNKMLNNESGPTYLSVDVKKVDPAIFMTLMGVESGAMRRVAILHMPDTFELLDNLSKKLFPDSLSPGLSDTMLNQFADKTTPVELYTTYLELYSCALGGMSTNGWAPLYTKDTLRAYILGGDDTFKERIAGVVRNIMMRR